MNVNYCFICGAELEDTDDHNWRQCSHSDCHEVFFTSKTERDNVVSIHIATPDFVKKNASKF